MILDTPVDLVRISELPPLPSVSLLDTATVIPMTVQGQTYKVSLPQLFASPAAGDFQTAVNIEMPAASDVDDQAFTVRTSPTAAADAPFVVRADGRVSLNGGQFAMTDQEGDAFLSIGDSSSDGGWMTYNAPTGESTGSQYYENDVEVVAVYHDGAASTFNINTAAGYGITMNAQGGIAIDPNTSTGLTLEKADDDQYDNLIVKAGGSLSTKYYAKFSNYSDVIVGGFRHDGVLDWVSDAHLGDTGLYGADVSLIFNEGVTDNEVAKIQYNAVADELQLSGPASYGFQDGYLDVANTENSVGAGYGSMRTAGGSYIAKDLWVDGNFTVNGTFVTQNVDTFTVKDPLVKYASDNAADAVDIGWYGQYNDGTTKYNGIFRDASDSGTFKFFQGLEVEPTTTVDTAGTGFAYAAIETGAATVGGLLRVTDTTPATAQGEGCAVFSGGMSVAGGTFIGCCSGSLDGSLTIEREASLGNTLFEAHRTGSGDYRFYTSQYFFKMATWTVESDGTNLNMSTWTSSTKPTGAVYTFGSAIWKETNGIEFGLDGINTRVYGAPLHSTNEDDATSLTTGAFRSYGGAAITKALWVGGLANIAGVTTISNTTQATGATDGALLVAGGVDIAKALYVAGASNIAGITTISDTTQATGSTDGALVVAGGADFAKNVYITGTSNLAGITTISNTTQATGSTDGALIVSGGADIAKALYVAGKVDAPIFNAQSDVVTYTADEEADYALNTNLVWNGGLQNVSIDGTDFALASSGAAAVSAGWLRNGIYDDFMIDGNDDHGVNFNMMEVADYGIGNNTFTVDLNGSTTFNKVVLVSTYAPSRRITSAQLRGSTDNFVGSDDDLGTFNVTGLKPDYAMSFSDQTYTHLRIIILADDGVDYGYPRFTMDELKIYNSAYATTDHDGETDLITGASSITVPASALELLDDSDVDISGTGKANIAYNKNVLGYSSFMDLETFRALPDFTGVTSFSVKVEPVSGQIVKTTSMSTENTQAQVNEVTGIFIKKNGATNFSVNPDGDVYAVTANIDSLQVNSVYTFPTVDGTVGQVMKTDGAGVVTWQADSGMSFPVLAPDGTAADPSYSFATYTSLGVYASAADTLGIAAGGVLRMSVSATKITTTVPIITPTHATIPQYQAGSSGVGMGFTGSKLAFWYSGTQALKIDNVTVDFPVIGRFLTSAYFAEGASGTPSITFTTANSTGLYKSGTFDFSATNNTVRTVDFNTTSLHVRHTLDASSTTVAAFTVAGGGAIAKGLYVGTTIDAGGDFTQSAAATHSDMGEISVFDNTTGQTTNGTINTFDKITQFADNGVSRNCTNDAANDEMTVDNAGTYDANFQLSFSGTANTTYVICLAINGTPVTKTQLHRKLGAGGDVGAGPCGGILTLAATDVVSALVKCPTSTSASFVVSDANLSLIRT